MTRKAYFDHNATTPVDPAVIEAMLPYLTDEWGNASSVHDWGKQARYGVEKARVQVAASVSCPDTNLIFTSGGTEAINTVLHSVVRRFPEGDCHIVTSSIEHPAVYRCLDQLERDGKVQVTYVDPGMSGVVDPEAFREAAGPSTRLFSLMFANNEMGAIQPVEQIVEIGRNLGIPVHSDTVQAFGKVPLDLCRLEVDFASFSAHKLYGPKGVGGLYFRDRDLVTPMLQGGGQEMKLRPGTENVAGIVGFGAAAELSRRLLKEEGHRLQELRQLLQDLLVKLIPDTYVVAAEAGRLPGTLCVCYQKTYGTYVVLDLAEEGFAVSSGSACSTNKSEPSHVLLAMGIAPELAQSAVRYSMGRTTTEEQVRAVAEASARVVAAQRANPPDIEEEIDLLSICD